MASALLPPPGAKRSAADAADAKLAGKESCATCHAEKAEQFPDITGGSLFARS